jgi:glycosyltransferase involved in cell wall biosynthesis
MWGQGLMSYSVSVIVPHFRDLKGLEKALDSIYRQSMLPQQVIVVDDDSGPRYWAELEVLAKNYGFDLFHQTNQGQSAARNFGVDKSNTTHVCFLDQDDLFLENHIEDLLNAWDDDPRLAFVYGDAWRQSESGEVYVRTTFRPELDFQKTDVFDLARRDMVVTPGMTMFSKSHFLEVGGFDPKLRGYEDDDLLFRISVSGYTGRKITNPVMIWTYNLSSTSFSIAMQKSRGIYFGKLHDFFNQPFFMELGLDPFRDILFNRFYKQMMNDAVGYSRAEESDFAVVQNNLREFCELALKSDGLTLAQRRSLKFSRFVMSKVTKRHVRLAFEIGQRAKRLFRL